VPQRVESYEPDGIDFAWIMQTTFVLTIVVGAPVVALLSTTVSLPTWGSQLNFAIRVGAAVWLAIGLAVYGYARRQQE